MGYPIIIRFRLGLKPSPCKRLQAAAGARQSCMCRGGEATGGADEHLPSTARIHRRARRGGSLAAGGPGATAAGNAGDRVS